MVCPQTVNTACSLVIAQYFHKTYKALPKIVGMILLGSLTYYTIMKIKDHLDFIRLKKLGKNIREGSEVLDVGSSYFENPYLPLKNTTGIDLYPPKANTSYNSFVKGDINDALLLEKSFDIVIIGETLEHVQNPTLTLKNIKRLLKEQGILRGTVPKGWIDQFFLPSMRHDIPEYQHLHLFSKGLLRILLERCGYKKVKVKGFLKWYYFQATK